MDKRFFLALILEMYQRVVNPALDTAGCFDVEEPIGFAILDKLHFVAGLEVVDRLRLRSRLLAQIRVLVDDERLRPGGRRQRQRDTK